MEFAKKLKLLMNRHRWSQERLAAELGVSQNLVSLWTRGKSLPDLSEAKALADALGVEVNFLADDGRDEPAPSGLTPEENGIVFIFRAMRKRGLSGQAAIDLLSAWESSDGRGRAPGS